MSQQKQSNFWNTPLTSSLIKGKDVKLPEMLLGYFIGPVGGLLSSGIFTSILNTYFTDVLKLDLTFLTTLQLVSTILIVIANLVVGQLIERTRVLAGKARPWILLSALTLSVASVLMFIVPFEGVMKMVWIAIAYNLYYSVAYPIYNTANSTLVAVSTRNSDQRGQLASFTNIAGLAAMGAGSMVFPILVSFALKENQALWFVAMLAVGILTALTVFLQYKFSRERVTEELMESGEEEQEEDKPKAASMGTQFKAVASEKWWWVVMIFYMIFQFSGAIKNGSMSYFCRWVLDNSAMGADAWGTYQSILAIMGAIPMAVAMLFVNPLCQKFGKRTTVSVFLVLGVIGGVIAGMGGSNIVPVAVGVALKCLGSSPACYMILAMLADVIDHIEWKTGLRTDGLTMSIYSSLMVAASPVMNAVFSAILNAVGYDQNLVVGTGMQSALAQTGISVSYIWIETVAYAVCAVLLFLFFHVEDNLKAEQAEIEKRNKAAK
ncbi:MFS transporter [Mediterraneibacter glycyrrhizinilyticus]|uniref:MFS transporter n=1 Tax=Mediterraneibacter glycyrrhizinilyticus TaxID=342942 RepID=UPI00195FDE44|nr:MFS transporter [Mediterraneibacter glycyrrhizinilyticus]MBM6801841.1 MFS transporter [Mediterraneibacter glycyrrhizinilyticus]MDM8125008.1 MFS transporter [Mediterraneibacter glycyrrhizinilyticus]MDM8211446.1 MFS transporter [Mediterraneibacter glycyrrhizinilyticus]